MIRTFLNASALLALSLPFGGAAAQVVLDQADPAYIEPSLPQPAPAPAASAPPVRVEARGAAAPTAIAPLRVGRIEVAGNQELPTTAFEAAIRPYLNRALGQDDLRALAGAVGAAARSRGYPFASAAVRVRPDAPGTVVVDLDEGRITAVRLLGTANAAAERILQRLVSDEPVTRARLERLILLVGDVPGIRIVNSRFARQDGFGILFVEAREDKASAYAQLDNRGSDAIGPFRSTLLASLRSLARDGDQLSVIAAQTPFDPREFMFARLRYDIPLGDDGAVLSVSGSAGRTHPGAALRRLDVIGHSYDLAVAYQRPLLRRRAASVWANFELRHSTSDQSLRGTPIRDDEFTTLTATLLGEGRLAGGSFRSEAGLIWGLPLDGVTRPSDPLASRPDGSGRFVVGHAWAEWAREVAGPVSLRLAAEAQLASRPLLASMELGAGGPAFGRAFDYGERTGDQGVLGSAELRVDLPAMLGGTLRAIQAYGFVDAGYVDNLRDGFGGGSLASSGGGLRFSLSRISFGLEAAAPLNSDRLDTGNRNPRFSFRTAAQF